jgi:undecaprenyl-diphosphatase
MSLFQSIVLGIIQGASEFLPISSSGHLVLAPYLFGWDLDPAEAFIFDVLVQVATLLAVIVFYWADLVAILKSVFLGLAIRKPFQGQDARLGWFLVLATVPAGVSALLFKDTFEAAFSSPKFAAIFLLCTSALLILGELFGKRKKSLPSIVWYDALIIGLFQVFALFPGISRSGATISGGLLRGFDRKSSARFSFLMAVPVMLAAGTLASIDLVHNPALFDHLLVYLPGFVTAAVVGYLAIRWFISFLSSKSLYIFAIYCAVVGSLFLVRIVFSP